jgi:predicted peroxiredoxin
MARILSIVERAYHGTLEEQEDTILWINHALKNAGADVAVLLRSNAVNYAVRGQDASGLHFGATALRVPPELDEDVAALIAKGVTVHAVREDVEERGIAPGELVEGVELIGRHQLAGLLDNHDRVWHW